MLGMHGSVAANKAVGECDLLIAVGARFDDRVTGKVSEFAQHACKAHIDIDPTAIGKRVPIDIPVVGDIKNVLTKLLEQIHSVERTEWVSKVTGWAKTHPFEYDRNSPKLLPEYVIEKIYELTKGEAIIVTDVGQHQMWAAQFYKYIYPRSLITSGGLGTMGFGLPAAIGAQAGRPDKLVINIAGDGSIQMNFQEMVVAVEHKFPVKVVVINNRCFGMVRQWQQLFYKGEYSISRLCYSKRIPIERICYNGKCEYLPDFVRLAEAHGAVGMRVTEKEKLVPTLEKAFSISGPVLVECIVEEEENVFPMVPPGASLKEMIHRMI
jgi:acetolactate synthase-1/2/3 large subunit